MSAPLMVVKGRADEREVAAKRVASAMRKPPAYQTYASDDLASEGYYGMSLASRGLYDAMLRVIWVDGYVPKDPALLAKAVRAEATEVKEALVPGLLAQFEPLRGDPGRLTYPELERQRGNYQLLREQQRLGGKKGADRRYRQRDMSTPIGKPMGPELNCNEVQRTEKKPTQEVRKRGSSSAGAAEEPWVQEYEGEEKQWGEANLLSVDDQGGEDGN
jgi:hypothetical protein